MGTVAVSLGRGIAGAERAPIVIREAALLERAANRPVHTRWTTRLGTALW
jgi:hypothetical protein